MKCGGPCSVVFLASFSLLAVACPAWAGGSAYTFSINGQPVTPQHYSLNADPSVFVPGDVIYLGDKEFDYGGLFMTLGEERDCRFVTASGQTSTAEGRGPPAIRGTVAYSCSSRTAGARSSASKSVGRSANSQLIRTTKRKARARGRKNSPPPSGSRTILWIPCPPKKSMGSGASPSSNGPKASNRNWPMSIRTACASPSMRVPAWAVNPDRSGAGRCFPRYRRKLAYPMVERTDSWGIHDFSPLAQFRDLVFLKFRSFASEPLDAGWICQNASLRCLDISGCGFSNHQKLASLTELRYLDISRCQDFDNLEFVKDMRQLRTLCMGLTRISSLSPLDNSDAIRDVYAGMTNVSVLPKGELRSLPDHQPRVIKGKGPGGGAVPQGSPCLHHPVRMGRLAAKNSPGNDETPYPQRRHVPPANRRREDARGNYHAAGDQPPHESH